MKAAGISCFDIADLDMGGDFFRRRLADDASACRDDWRNESGDKTCSRYMSALIAVKLACSCLLGPFLTATQPGKNQKS